MKAPQKSLKKWTQQKWRTKSGKPSGKTGERYLPEKAIKSLSSAEYSATTKAKREGTKAGKQFVKQPKKVAEKVKKFRAAEGGVAMKKPSADQKGLKKLPKEVRNKMGYMNKGGMAAPKFKPCAGCPTPAKCTAAGKCLKKSGMYGGGMAKKKTGYNKGGYVNCGASMKPNGKSRK